MLLHFQISPHKRAVCAFISNCGNFTLKPSPAPHRRTWCVLEGFSGATRVFLWTILCSCILPHPISTPYLSTEKTANSPLISPNIANHRSKIALRISLRLPLKSAVNSENKGQIIFFVGTTFAWFTSKDEVTNRLSASAEYNVAIGENFEPPETFVPGQQVNKDSFAVNTGNVDAFVRTWLTGSMRLMKQNTTGSTTQIAGYTPASAGAATSAFGTSGVPTTSATTDASLINAGLTLMDTSGNYYRTLSKTQAKNPNLTLSSSLEGFTDTTKTALSEVQAMQSGILAYAPTDAEYTYILNQPTMLTVKVATIDGTAPATGSEYQTVEIPAGTLVHVGGTAGNGITYAGGAITTIPTATYTDIAGNTGTAVATVYVKAQTHDDTSTYFTPVDVEYETFVPITDGLYLFLRNEADADQSDPEFSGYYKITQDIVNAQTGGTPSEQVVYYAEPCERHRLDVSGCRERCR